MTELVSVTVAYALQYTGKVPWHPMPHVNLHHWMSGIDIRWIYA